MADTYTSRIDENTKINYDGVKTFIIYEDKSYNITNYIEITNIRNTIIALQDVLTTKAREW